MTIRRSLVSFSFSCLLCFESIMIYCYAESSVTLNQGQKLKASDNFDELVSANGVFKLGFFHPGSSFPPGPSSNSYLAIWYNKLPNNPEAVWIANPNNPIRDSSGVFELDFDGKLKLTSSEGQPYVLNPNQQASGNVTAFLIDSGNFVLSEVVSNGTLGKVLWQSFDYPTNILLPGMKLGVKKSGRNLALSSWLSGQVPSPGAFRVGVDPGGTNQLVLWQREEVYWTSGEWRNGSFQNAPDLTRRTDLFEFSFVSNEEEKYFSYSVKNSFTLSRWEVNSWGQILQFVMAINGTSWKNSTIVSSCRLPNKGNPNQVVCIKQKPSKCRTSSEIFEPRRGYLNSTKSASVDFSANSTLSDCQASCWRNCSCIACVTFYPNGTGCLYLSNISDFFPDELYGFGYFPASVTNREGTPIGGSRKRDSVGSTKRWWWIRLVIASVLVPTILVLCYLYYRRRKLRVLQQRHGRSSAVGHPSRLDHSLLELRSRIRLFNTSSSGDHKLRRRGTKSQDYDLFSFSDIVATTQDFSVDNKLGEGGFGSVYKGTQPNGQQIAVKRLSSSSGQGVEEFMNEITLIAELQHTNLVRLLGCCLEGVEKMLVYEYMPNKSLDSFLFDPSKAKLLDWTKRVDIIEGIAQELLYLHKYSRLKVIHRDLKASNILLDQDMNPKISDFGTARIFEHNESRANTKKVIGTYGYMSPEYAMNGIFSVKSDVFSFGVLLLEIVSSRKNTIYSSSGTALTLIEYAWDLWTKGKGVDQLVEASLGLSCSEDQLLKYVNVGLLCVQEHATDRPTMSQVVSMLSNDVVVLPDPKQPAFVIRTNVVQSGQSGRSSDIASVNGVSITVLEAR